MRVLSLFDGMSGAQIALNRVGITNYTYYASEIDKYAIQVTKDNYPNTIHIGDVSKVDGTKLGKIDLLVGGSPCQGFSKAGKGLNFNDPRSKLFFEYVRILKEVNPTYFLLENVRMKQEHQDIISDLLGVKPIAIDSSLVSGQSRNRFYWTNIPGIEKPQDKGILLKDILQSGSTDREKSYCLDANYYKGGGAKLYFRKGRRQVIQVNPDKSAEGKQPKMQDRVYSEDGISPCLTSEFADRVKVETQPQSVRRLMNTIPYRKLTPIECERLQTIPDDYSKSVSNTQRYKMLGNGFTVDVIAHIFKQMLYWEEVKDLL